LHFKRVFEAKVTLSLDIAKAFDTVPHDLLLRSLSAAGLSSASVKIIASMLLGHKCIVGDSSSPRHFVVFIHTTTTTPHLSSTTKTKLNIYFKGS
jgi:hypothetical protein